MNQIKNTTALEFLQTLEQTLASRVPTGANMNPVIRGIIADAKTDNRKKHLRLPEAAFLNHFVLPTLFEQLQEQAGLTADQSKEALLNEYHRSMPEISRYSPIRAWRHPFKKVLGASAESIYRDWKSPRKGDGLTQSCPDFALREPFPHSIVFEGKYYSSGSTTYANKQLATDLYQAFFYRGLPQVPPTKRGHPRWKYDYACLLAFDASRDGTLRAAWDGLPAKVRRSFWEGANIYVMILGGQGTVAGG
jgi:hypothetical protein